MYESPTVAYLQNKCFDILNFEDRRDVVSCFYFKGTLRVLVKGTDQLRSTNNLDVKHQPQLRDGQCQEHTDDRRDHDHQRQFGR